MHISWNKSKLSRISRLVAGLCDYQSPKRGASLVAETGFPTSVVDLFAKNRDRLPKSSKRKSSSSSSPAHPQSPSPPAPCNGDLQSPDMVFITRQNNDDKRIPFHAALQVSLAVALAVSTGSLAIWIMMAALLLVLIEFVGARFLGFLRPEPNTLFFNPGIPMGSKSRTDELVVKQRGTDQFPDPPEFVELEDELKTETGKEMEMEMETTACKNEHSWSARIRTSLIKKFVPKKLRHGKRKKQAGKSNNSSKEPSSQPEKEKQEPEPGVDEEDESVDDPQDMVPTFDRVLQVESGVRKGNSGYVILIVILAGLVGGRGVALFLTLLCYFILICNGTRTQK